MNRVVDAACADLRRFAGERCSEWAKTNGLLDGNIDSGINTREQWRFWRENTLLDDLASQPLDGHRILLHGLLSDLHAGYQALRPHYTDHISPPTASDGIVERLQKLTRTSHLETQRLFSATRARLPTAIPRHSDPEILRVALAANMVNRSGDSKFTEHVLTAVQWSCWYAHVEKQIEQHVYSKVQALRFRQVRAATTIQNAFRAARRHRKLAFESVQHEAAISIQRAFRVKFGARLQRRCSVLRLARERVMACRLQRSLKRHFIWRRCGWRWEQPSVGGQWVHTFLEAQSASFSGEGATPATALVGNVIQIQSFCRGRWSRNGWAYCWSPPFWRPNTLSSRLKATPEALPALTAAVAKEFAALRARRRHRREAEELGLKAEAEMRVKEREERLRKREAAVRQKFEMQWSKYSQGLEAYIRGNMDKHEHWVATVDSTGVPCWLSMKTGKKRKHHPVEARVRENLGRERLKAEEAFERQLQSMQEAWLFEELDEDGNFN